MALLIYQKNNPQAIFVKGDMESLNKALEEMTKPGNKLLAINFDGWNGKPVQFFSPFDNWMHVEEWDDADVTKYLDDQKKRAEQKQRAMTTRGNQVLMPNPQFPGRRN